MEHGSLEKNTPVVIAFDQEILYFTQQVKSRKKLNEDINKSSNTLFLLWNKYESRVKKELFDAKILGVGDMLRSLQEYLVAYRLCYKRFLMRITGINEWLHSPMFEDIESCIFPKNTSLLDAENRIRALLGYASCYCLHVLSKDPLLKNEKRVEDVLLQLNLLQVTVQATLREERFCWLTYNGIIHIYSICKHLMSRRYSAKVLSFLIWTCLCMESSIPLMTAKYMAWRVHLYATTCQCFSDVNADSEAELFALRGLTKIAEMREIDQMTASAQTPEKAFIFNQSQVKLSVLVFKRNIFESRRRAKGNVRPKLKPALKDIISNPWPRTTTEKMLMDIFKGRAAQLLAVLEALTDSKKRLVHTAPGAAELDETHDVFVELFFAGAEIISGGGGLKPPIPGKSSEPIANYSINMSLAELAGAESDLISLTSVSEFVKLAYNLEAWETFDVLVEPLMNELEKHQDLQVHFAQLKILELLRCLSCVNPSRIKKKFVMIKTEDHLLSESSLSRQYKATHIDELISVCRALESSCEKKILSCLMSDLDILVDVALFMWGKCKHYFARVHSVIVEAYRFIYHDQQFGKWVCILLMVQRIMLKLGVANIDLGACGEASLKAAFVLLSFAGVDEYAGPSMNGEVTSPVNVEPPANSGHTYYGSLKLLHSPFEEEAHSVSMSAHRTAVCSFLGIAESQRHLLAAAKDVLFLCLAAINEAHDCQASPDGFIADDSFKTMREESEVGNLYQLNMGCLHVEILICHHYAEVLSQAADEGLTSASIDPKPKKKREHEVKRSHSLLSTLHLKAKKNLLSRSIYLIAQAEAVGEKDPLNAGQFLKEAYATLDKATRNEQKIRDKHAWSPVACRANVPPAPVLVYRGSSTMIFKPAPFVPDGDEEVAWYRLFVRNAAGNNVKVRLSDLQFRGCGDEVPNHEGCVLQVDGLIPDEKYMAAVAAYTAGGKLIGGSIGQSCFPIISAYPLPIVLGYGYLAKVAYKCNVLPVAKEACAVLWDHYTIKDDSSSSTKKLESLCMDFKIDQKRLDYLKLKNSSTVSLRYFVQSVFISVDISVKEKSLFCDVLCDGGPLRQGQVSRCRECEKLLVALEVSGWLNDSMLCLQSMVYCYGLLAPILYWHLPVKSVVHILTYTLGALQEVQGIVRSRHQTKTTDAFQHMLACIVIYVSKMFTSTNQKTAALQVLEIGASFLNQLIPPDSATTISTQHAADASNAPVKKAKKNKRGKGAKMAKSSSGSALDPASYLKVVELCSMRIRREVEGVTEFELTGSEDPLVFGAVSSFLPLPQAFREVMKFKRRSQFLEHFVGVLARAFQEKCYDYVVDWSQDALCWLTKRNEVLLNKVASDPRGIVVVAVNSDEDKAKKFSAAVVEYGKPAEDSVADTREVDDASAVEQPVKEGSPTPRLQARKRSMKSHAQAVAEAYMSDLSLIKSASMEESNQGGRKIPNVTQEEKALKDAMQRLHSVLPDYYKMSNRRRKMRLVSQEEFPWRCQMNMLLARSHFAIFVERFLKMSARLGLPDLQFDENGMSFAWFTLATSGGVIVSWAGCMREAVQSLRPTVDQGGRRIEHEKEVHIVANPSKRALGVKVERKLSRASKKSGLTESSNKHLSSCDFQQSLESVFACLQRALVLAHRGCNWVLLQNVCFRMFAMVKSVIAKTILLTSAMMEADVEEAPYDVLRLRGVILRPFCMASDFLLDMITVRARDKVDKTLGCRSFGDVSNYHGGASLRFDKKLDNSSSIDMGTIKHIVCFTVEVLYYAKKWEKLVSIVLRFNSLTNDLHAEFLLPLLIFAQRQLASSISSEREPPLAQPELVFDEETGVLLTARLRSAAPLSIPVSAHIDPVGHRLYQVPEDGKRHVSVPLDDGVSLNRLRRVLDEKPYAARALQHSRKLLSLYLVGKQFYPEEERRMRNANSQVSFLASQVRSPCPTPVDFNLLRIETSEDVENYPLASEHLSVLIDSYERTISMLLSRQQKGLAAQAMHELGNLMFHSGNIKSAYNQWLEGLDCVTKLVNCHLSWGELVDSNEQSMLAYKPLLDRCGIWGCVTAGVLAAKVARYIHVNNVSLQTDLCLLSAAMFKALFSCSLPHPTSKAAYAAYDIGPSHPVKYLLPGVNLMSDMFRADCGAMFSAIVWVAEELIVAGFNIEVLPLLSLAQYLASVVCEDLQRAVQVKLLRVRCLSDMALFGEASTHLLDVFAGSRLTGCSESERQTLKHALFANDKAVTDPTNIKTVHGLTFLVMSAVLASQLGKDLCDEVRLCQANLLAALAAAIYAVPKNSSKSEISSETLRSLPEEVADANSKGRPQAGLGASTTGRKEKLVEACSDLHVADIKKWKLSPEYMKGALLLKAEELAAFILEGCALVSNPTDAGIRRYIDCQLLMARITSERLMGRLAAEYVHEALKTIASHMKTLPASRVVEEIEDLASTTKPTDSRARINGRLWLKCRRLLAHYLLDEDDSMLPLQGVVPHRSAALESHIEFGLIEADIFVDKEAECDFRIMKLILETRFGQNTDVVVSHIKELTEVMANFKFLSRFAKELDLRIRFLRCDIQAMICDDNELVLNDYLGLVRAILDELLLLGCTIDKTTMYPIVPYSPINSNLFLRLVSAKLRVGRVQFTINATAEDASLRRDRWQMLLEQIDEALLICKQTRLRSLLVHAELLFLKGTIQHRFYGGTEEEAVSSVCSFLEVIRCSVGFTQDLRLIRQSYLEMALIFHKCAEDKEMLLQASAMELDLSPSKSKKRANIEKKRKSVQKGVQRLKKAIWLCVRASGMIAKSQKSLTLLVGELTTTVSAIHVTAADALPTFALVELAGNATCEREASASLRSGLTDADVSMMRSKVEGKTWVPILSYFEHLQRKCHYSSLAFGGSSSSCVQIPDGCERQALKLASMHDFLSSHLGIYEKECCPLLPVEVLVSIVAAAFPSSASLLGSSTGADCMNNEVLNVPSSSAIDVLSAVEDSEDSPSVTADTPSPGLDGSNSVDKMVQQASLVNVRNLVQAREFEFALQWYQHELLTDHASLSELTMLLAVNTKPVAGNVATVVFAQGALVLLRKVGAVKVRNLYDSLRKLMHVVEAFLCTAEGASKSAAASQMVSAPGGHAASVAQNVQSKRKNKSVGIKQLAVKPEMEDEVRKSMVEALQLVPALFAQSTEVKNATFNEFPSDSAVSNISSLLNLFDPCLGYICRLPEDLHTWLSQALSAGDK